MQCTGRRVPCTHEQRCLLPSVRCAAVSKPSCRRNTHYLHRSTSFSVKAQSGESQVSFDFTNTRLQVLQVKATTGCRTTTMTVIYLLRSSWYATSSSQLVHEPELCCKNEIGIAQAGLPSTHLSGQKGRSRKPMKSQTKVADLAPPGQQPAPSAQSGNQTESSAVLVLVALFTAIIGQGLFLAVSVSLHIQCLLLLHAPLHHLRVMPGFT